jgi:transcriptional regulator with XRE-family HTH domain
MPNISRKPSFAKAAKLSLFLKNKLSEKGVSLRFAAKQMGISPAHLSYIISGINIPDAGVCNAIADFLNTPRVQVYGLAGWLDLGEQDDKALTILLTSFTATPEQLSQLKWIYNCIGDKAARGNFLNWVQESHDNSLGKTLK